MEDLYALYLHLHALKNADASQDFANLVKASIPGGSDPAKRVEVIAVAAIATTTFVIEDEGVTSLLDFYEFQQQWERYRNLAPKA